PLPLDLSTLGSAGAVLDMVYGTEPTPWVASARALGIPAVDGIPMLIAQGAAAVERWWGVPAPVDAMRAALTVLARCSRSEAGANVAPTGRRPRGHGGQHAETGARPAAAGSCGPGS